MTPRLGPKWTMILMSIPAVVGWICLVITKPLDDSMDPLALFYIGRILTGFAGGAFTLVVPLYVSDIAEVRIRGALGGLMQFMLCVGLCFVNTLSINGAVGWVSITGMCITSPGKIQPFTCFFIELG